jgi:hypothetical protein
MLSVNSAFNTARPVYINKKSATKISFTADSGNVKNNVDDTRNPINKVGEYCVGIQKSFYKSLKTAGRACAETAYYGAGSTNDLTSYIIMCATVGVLCGIGSFIIEFPKNLYEANINFFAKKEQANVDLATYSTQKVLLDQINLKGKTASEEEKQELAKDLLKVKKNQTGVRDYRNFNPFEKNQ